MSNYSMYKLCKRHRNQYVRVVTCNHMVFHGYVSDVDREHLHLLIPEDDESRMENEESEDRSFFPGGGFGGGFGPGFGPGFGGGFGHGFGNPFFFSPFPVFFGGRRFRHALLPLAFLAGISTWG